MASDPATHNAIAGFCQQQEERLGIPYEIVSWEPRHEDCPGRADALVRVGGADSGVKVLVEATKCFRGAKGEGGAFSHQLVTLDGLLRHKLAQFAAEERLGVDLHVNLDARDPLEAQTLRLLALVRELPILVRETKGLLGGSLEEPLTVSANGFSQQVADAVDVCLVTPNIRSHANVRYRVGRGEAYSWIPGTYVGIDHEGIQAAISEKLAKHDQYRCIARSLGAEAIILLVVVDGSSPASVLASHPALWFEGKKIPTLSSKPNFDEIHLVAWGSWVEDSRDLYQGYERGVWNYRWAFSTLRQ